MKKSLIFIFSLLIAGSLFGQDEYNLYKPTVIPQNPDVASLLKYLEAPVSPATGIASSNIPIYSINEGKISYNINLSYNASGIRVNETASSVGLGWSINTPKIVRTVRGIADDVVGGFINEQTYTVEAVKTISGDLGDGGDAPMKVVQRLIKIDGLDLESDQYSIFLPSGENIQFMFNQNRSQQNPKGEIVTVPKSFVKIIPGFTNNRITSWQVIDVDGTKYTFGGGGYIYENKSYNFGSDLPTLEENLFYNEFSSSWDLQKIESIDNRKIEFFYIDNLENENCSFVNQLRAASTQGNSSYTHARTNEKVTYLSSIEGDFGSVKFYWGEREDYIGKKLQKIKIENKETDEIKSALFEYSYTQPGSNTIPNSMIYCEKTLNKSEILEQISKRMFLNKITFKKGENELHKYEFEYDPEPLPYRFSRAQDWWGFYNGENNNDNLAYDPYATFWDENKTKRQINAEMTQAGLLKKIKYPTGGHSEFVYENNRGVFKHKGLLFFTNNIIPANIHTETIEFSPGTGMPIEMETDYGMGYVYPEQEFSTDNDVINYFRSGINNPNDLFVNLYIEIELSSASQCDCDNCDDEDHGLPTELECYSRYWIYKENGEEVEGTYVFNGKKYFIEVPVGTISGIFQNPQKYKLKLIGFDGHAGGKGEEFDPNNELVQFKLHWFVYDPDQVKKVGTFEYEIPIGGVRMKEIKYVSPGENNDNGILKRYSYKNDEGIESARYDVWIDNLRMIGHQPYVNSSNNFPLQTSGSNVLVYENFTEKMIDFNNPSAEDEEMNTVFQNIYHEGVKSDGCHFFQEGDYQSRSTPCFQHPLNGKTHQTDYGIKKRVETVYTANGDVPMNSYDLKWITGIDYNTPLFFKDLGYFNDFCGNWCIEGVGTPNLLPFLEYFYYDISQFYDEQVKEVETTTYLNDEFIEKTTSQFDTFYTFLPTETTTTNSLGETLKTEYQYPHNLAGQRPLMSTLVADNRIAEPVVVKTKNLTLNKPLSIQETVYEKDATTANYILPKYIFAKSGSETLNYSPTGEDIRITYDKYDNKGNLLQYSLANGTPVSIIWGYNGQYPIAKVEGLEYGLVQTEADALIGLSNSGSLLADSFESLRKKEGALVTSYIYDPLVGIIAIIQPDGQKATYEYDNAGRLELIKDQNEKVLKEIEYNYYNQQP